MSLQAYGQNRRRSQFSLMSDNVRRTSQSSRRLPSEAGTEQSYDLYRPSRYQITNPHADYANITVLRNASGASQRRRVQNHGPSMLHPAVARLQEDADFYDISSSPPPLPTNYGQSGRYSIDSSRRNFSRSSIVSSQRRRESSVICKSISYKRNVVFNPRKRSASGMNPNTRASAPPEIPPRKHHRSQHSSSSPTFLTENPSPQITTSPVVHSRKEREAKAYDDLITETAKQKNRNSGFWKDEARIVSNELARFCDQAFSDSPAASSLPKQVTSKIERATSRDNSPGTQIVDPSEPAEAVIRPLRVKNSIDKEILNKRPLPEPPRGELSRSRTQIELAAARKKLEQQAAKLAPGALDDVFAQLDRLMEPSRQRPHDPDSDKRISSAPDSNCGFLSPVREEDEDLRRFGMASSRRRQQDYRAASDPTSHRNDANDRSPTKRQYNRDRPSIRIVREDSSLRVPPLVIRKKSDSTVPTEQSLHIRLSKERLTDPRPTARAPPVNEFRPTTQAPQIVPSDRATRPQSRLGFYNENSVGLSLLERQLEPIEEDEDKENEDPRASKRSSGDSKKRIWFKRMQPRPKSIESDRAPTPPMKDGRSPVWESSNEAQSRKRASDVPSNPSNASAESEKKKEKPSARVRFFNIFSKRDSKETKKPSELALNGTLDMLTLLQSTSANTDYHRRS